MSGRHSEKEAFRVVGAAAFVVGLVGLAVFGLNVGSTGTRVPTVLGIAAVAVIWTVFSLG
jgi:hypothetical protein